MIVSVVSAVPESGWWYISALLSVSICRC